MGARRVRHPLRQLLPGGVPVQGVHRRRPRDPRGAVGRLRDRRAGRSGHEPRRVPEGRRLEPHARRAGARAASAHPRRRARRRPLAASVVGRSAGARRRRHPGRAAGPGPGRRHLRGHAGAGRPARVAAARRAVLAHRRGADQRQRQHQRLRAGAVPDLRQVQRHGQRRRLVPLGADHHHVRESRVHVDHPVPLPRRGALQGRGGDHDSARLLAVDRARRRVRAGARRLRRGARAVDVQGHYRRGAVRPRVRHIADGPAAPAARRHRALPARERPARGRQRLAVLLARRGDRTDRRGAARHARCGRRAPGDRGRRRGGARRRIARTGAAGVRRDARAAGRVRSRARAGAVRHASGRRAQARPQGGDAAHELPHGDDVGQILSRRPRPARVGAGGRTHR